jgi:hypothetical protein
VSDRLRRYEILLPLRYNDGRRIPGELLSQTRTELRDRFGALSSETQIIRGDDAETESDGDELVRVFIDVPDSQENRDFFKATQERLAERFEQVEILVTTFPVERL